MSGYAQASSHLQGFLFFFRKAKLNESAEHTACSCPFADGKKYCEPLAEAISHLVILVGHSKKPNFELRYNIGIYFG